MTARCALHYAYVNWERYQAYGSAAAQLTFDIPDQRTRPGDRLAQPVARHAELPAPVSQLVVLIDVDEGVVLPPDFAWVIRHEGLLAWAARATRVPDWPMTRGAAAARP